MQLGLCHDSIDQVLAHRGGIFDLKAYPREVFLNNSYLWKYINFPSDFTHDEGIFTLFMT